MNLKELKLAPLQKIAQAVTFKADGSVIESDDTLVKVDQATANVFTDTLFQGMEYQINSLSRDEKLSLDCIRGNVFGKESYFDLIVQHLEEDTYVVLIYDFGDKYGKIMDLQQERNVANINLSKLKQQIDVLQQQYSDLNLLYENLKQDNDVDFALVKTDNLLINVDFNEIYYVEAFGDYVKFITDDKVYLTHNTLKNVESILPSKKFFRIHRSYIVRLDKIKNIEQSSLQIKDKVLVIGRQYKAALLDKMKLL